MEQTTSSAKCAFCGSQSLTEVMNFGDVAIAGAFLKKDQLPAERKYPLVIVFCRDCYVVQVRDHIDPHILFSTDFYFSSAIKTLRDHFADYATEVADRFIANAQRAVVLEFGSNDGVLLKPLADKGIKTVIGVDPAKNIVNAVQDDRLVLINDFFTVPVAESLVSRYGKADVVTGNNVFAHISDINGITDAVRTMLADEGVFVFEVHYLGNIIQGMQYDFIYHEHIYYYSLLALENHLGRHGMVIFDLKPVPTHGGSIRYYVAKKGSKRARAVSSSVRALHDQEVQLGYDTPGLYAAFGQNVALKKQRLMALLDNLKKDGRKIVGYGASGRANTIMQYCGITDAYLDYVVDDAPAKIGLYTPGTHLEIKSSEALLLRDKPDYVLLLAWAFYDEIVKRNQAYCEAGGKIIVPLPDVRVLSFPDAKGSI